MAKKVLKNKNNETTSKTKMKDSEVMMKRMEYLVENKLVDPNLYYNGQMYDFDGLDIQNLKRIWELLCKQEK